MMRVLISLLALVLCAASVSSTEPVGTILAWHNGMPGTPLLPDGWERCNGQTLDDPDSPYHGVTLPDLNLALRHFLRGGPSSGVFQDDAFQGHHHHVTHDASNVNTQPDWGELGSAQMSMAPAWFGVGDPTDDGVNGTPRTAHRTRPVNISMVWLIKTKTASVPIGAVAAWHKDLPGTPPLSPSWVECNGQVIGDAESPYFNLTTPDLNGQAYFLRGTTVSGLSETDALQGHHHDVPHNAVSFHTFGPIGLFTSAQLAETQATVEVGDPTTDNVNDAPRSGTETRPVNMSVVWVMKIKPGLSPRGTVLAWHRDLPGTPAAPLVLECNGQTVDDALSPYDGLTLPDLNGEGRFLRGGAQSGVLQQDSFQGHRHSLLHTAVRVVNGPLFSGTALFQGWHHQPASIVIGDAIDDGWHGTPRTADETRPVNMSVIWVLNHKHPWRDMGGSVAGTAGTPVLIGTGPLVENEPYTIELSNVAVGLNVNLVIGYSLLNAPFKSGTLVPNPDLILFDLPTVGGELVLSGDWPTGLPAGIPFYVQYWIPDAAGPSGFAASNGLGGTPQEP